MAKQSHTQRILLELKQRPMATPELSEHLGIKLGTTASILNRLYGNNVLRIVRVSKNKFNRDVFIYAINDDLLADRILDGKSRAGFRYCAQCGDRFYPRDGETPSAFKKRRTCSRECGQSFHNHAKQLYPVPCSPFNNTMAFEYLSGKWD